MSLRYPTFRRSQLLSTYAPGAMVDLPHTSVIIGGIDHWAHDPQEIVDVRLQDSITQLLRPEGGRRLPLYAPRAYDAQGPNAEQSKPGVVAYPFPGWAVTRATFRWPSGPQGTVARAMVQTRNHNVKVQKNGSAVLTHLTLPEGVEPAGTTRKRGDKDGYPLVAMRFVAACQGGHLDDIRWRVLVHRNKRQDPATTDATDEDGSTSPCHQQLWLVERSTAGELRGTTVECECGASLHLPELLGGNHESSPLGPCRGASPWFGHQGSAPGGCAGPNHQPFPLKFLVRHASHAHFPVMRTALSLPERSRGLQEAFDTAWTQVLANTPEEIWSALLHTQVLAPFVAHGGTERDLHAMAAKKRAAAGKGAPKRGLTEDELDLFLQVEGTHGADNARSVFTAERLPLPAARPDDPAQKLGRVVLVKRLRVVQALVGFTRLDTQSVLPDEELDLPVTMAPIAQDLQWIPAVENRGEGIFVLLDPQAVAKWLRRPALVDYATRMGPAIRAALRLPSHTTTDVLEGELGRMLVHTLSHALLQQVALEAGYAAASIRERIYARPSVHLYGTLLYTSSPDAEGTLGGLVALGERIVPLLERALDAARLCSHDPVCSHQEPDADATLAVGAACHGCLYVSESSCSMRNQLLDRALLVPTVADAQLAFFG